MMELGIMGAIVGVALGTLGTVIGTMASLRSASSNAERRSILGWAFLFFALIVAFLTALFLVPPPHHLWLWAIYAVALPLLIITCVRGQSRRKRTHRADGHG